MYEEHFWKKERFHLFKKHLWQNWRVENMSLVAGRLFPLKTRIRYLFNVLYLYGI